MKIFNKTPTFDFMAKRQIAIAFSLLLIIASIASLATKGLNFGLDFTGGTLIEVAYPQTADLNKVRNRLEKAGFGDAVVQNFGSSKDVLVRLAPRENTTSQSLGDKILSALKEDDAESGETRLYGVVLLSDGEDTMGEPTENQMFVTCLPANAEADGVKVFPIAFGEDAAEDVLGRIATVTGGRMFSADPDSISNAYLSISAEQ